MQVQKQGDSKELRQLRGTTPPCPQDLRAPSRLETLQVARHPQRRFFAITST